MSRSLELLQKAEQERKREQGGDGLPETESVSSWSEPAQTAEATAEVSAVVGAEAPALDAYSRDQINKLIQRLFLVPEGDVRVVVFSAVERGAGCSWLAAQVAQVLAAQARKSVCIVDANLRFPFLHDLFAVNNHHGLTDAVLAPTPLDDFLRQLQPNLWLLTCGSSEKNEPALMAPDLLLARIRQLRTRFSYVIVDTPPMSLFRDALNLGAAADGIAIVLKANSSRREIAQKALQDARSAKVRVLGAVLNQRTFPLPPAIYNRL